MNRIKLKKEIEVWKPITEQICDYAISNFGRIFSFKTNKVLKNCIKPGDVDYLVIYLRVGGKTIRKTVHILVANAFIENPENYPCVLHIDDNGLNPFYKNLKWGTRAQNVADCVAKGRNAFGEKRPNAKLTNKQSVTIRQQLKLGVTQLALSKKYGVSFSLISRIKHNKAYKIL